MVGASAKLDCARVADSFHNIHSYLMRLRQPIAVVLLLSGCAARSVAPTPSPVPSVGAVAPSAPQPEPVTEPGARDSAPVPSVTDSEVVARAAAIFDGVPAAPETAPAAGPAAADARPTWDIDVRSYETHEQVAQYVGLFTGRLRPYMQRTVSRGTRFDAILRRMFRDAGLPEDMTYLALIESSYSPHAYSRAAAVGMWQFMAPTARSVGMRVDWWVDERRDPMRATEGAIDFLTDLHNAYGSWYLAAAAYNGGPGRVSRGLRRFSDELDGSEGEDRFFALAEQKYLPSETKAYVPKLIAAAMVAKDPLRYGIAVDTLPLFAYDSVVVGGGVPLAAVAKASGVSLDAIRDLNPHYLRGVTPPGEQSDLRLPVGSAAGFAAAFSQLSTGDRVGWREERLPVARSAASIADEAGIPVKALRWVNPRLSLDRRGRVPAGTLLRIPTPLAVAGARDVPDPSIARFSSASRAPLVAQRVRVRRGESLASVAKRSGVTVAQLRSMNGLRSGKLRSGQVLLVRRPSSRAVLAARRAASARAAGSRGEAGRKCTSRVVRVNGKRRTVTSCSTARAPAASSARRTARGANERVAVRSTRSTVKRPARSASANNKSARARSSGVRAGRRGTTARTAVPRSGSRRSAKAPKASRRKR